jgi:hypothetical protein
MRFSYENKITRLVCSIKRATVEQSLDMSLLLLERLCDARVQAAKALN